MLYDITKSEADILSTLNKFTSDISKIIQRLGYGNDNAQHFVCSCLFVRIDELVLSCLKLFESKIYSTIPVLMRSMLEAFADLKILSGDAAYINNMMLSAHIEKRNYGYNLIQILDDDDRVKSKEFLTRLDDLDKKISEFKSKGVKKLTVCKRFEKAGLIDVYLNQYASFSSGVHVNVNSLEGSNLDNDGTICCYRDIAKEDKMMYIELIMSTLGVSSSLMAKVLGHSFSDDESKLLIECDNFVNELVKNNITTE